MLRFLAPLLALLIVTAPFSAFADDDREVAKAQFKEAKRLYDDEKYQPALKLFQLAWQFSSSPNARLYIGKCHLALEQYEPAYNELRGTLDDAAKTGDASYDNTRRAAAAELALIEPRVGRLLVVLADPDRATEVTVGGKPFDQFGEPVAQPTGSVEVKATSEGQEAIQRTTVVAGKTTSVALYFPPKVADSTEAPPPPPPPVEAPGYTPLQVGGFIAIGAGGAIMVGGGILGALAAGRFQALDSACEGQRCDDPSVNDVIDSGKTFELVSYIMLGVGGAGALTGGALVLFGGEGEPTEEEGASAVLDVAPLPGGGLLQLTGRF